MSWKTIQNARNKLAKELETVDFKDLDFSQQRQVEMMERLLQNVSRFEARAKRIADMREQREHPIEEPET